MRFLRALLLIVMLAGFVVASATSAIADSNALQVLDLLRDGRWELRIRQGGGVQNLCVGDRRRLIQLRHADLACKHIILEDTPTSATVQYTCRGHGYGRTHIRLETRQLIQVETQGVADGLPFEYSAEGRWISDCGD